ncbi:MAG: hypothetical protein H7A34_07935 [bacterium]|nr:hypothetical protein [bacterium]
MKRHVSLYGGYDENWARDIELNETIIDGQASSNVVIADNDSILDGFTIQNGKAEQGGGIYIKNVSSIISNCIVKNNVAHNDDHGANDYSDGAGLYAQNAGGTIKNCTFIGNYHSGNAQQSGGAIMLSYSSMLIENCIFENNYCPSTGDDEFGGGAIYNFFSIATIKNCKFAGNYVEGSSSIAALGGAIFSNNGSISKIIGCLFDSNRANKGSAAYGWGISLINCTVYNNISAVNNEAFLGVGPLVTNCIFLNNNYNDFSGFNINQFVTYSCIQDVGGGAGTIHVDPQLRDPDNGDFRLKITSPCVDTGTNSATYLDELTEDIHGESRIFGFITDNTVDMGADELHWEMIGIEHDNEDAITIEFQSFENDTYFVEYLDDDPSSTTPILHYRMNDNDSNTTVDERMGSVNGTFIDWESNPDANTDVHAVSGKSSNLNTALKFSGDKEFINCGNVANLTENFSFAFWAYLDEDTYSANRNIVNKADNSSWRIRVDQTTGKMRLILNFGSGAISYVFNHVFSTETWQHIVVLLNTTNGDANLYVNGTFEETISIQSSSLQSNSGDFKIGTFSTEAWLGMIDDVRVYDHLLTTPEIGFIYNHGNGTEESVKWHRVTTSVIGQEGTTSWTDDGSETSPAPDNDGVTQRLYRVVVGD